MTAASCTCCDASDPAGGSESSAAWTTPTTTTATAATAATVTPSAETDQKADSSQKVHTYSHLTHNLLGCGGGVYQFWLRTSYY